MRTMLLAVLVVGCGGREFETAREAEPESVAGEWVLMDTLVEAHGTACDVPFFRTDSVMVRGTPLAWEGAAGLAMSSMSHITPSGPVRVVSFSGEGVTEQREERVLNLRDDLLTGRTVVVLGDSSGIIRCVVTYATIGTR